MKSFKFLILAFSFAFLFFSFTVVGYAKEITIIYSGQSHGMIYPCACPIEPDGGVARRAALIKEIRSNHPDNLLLDSGDFFAGGLMDEYTQNTELDCQRSLVNLKAMELMKYDAVAIGDDEFNFGREFLDKAIHGSRLTFLLCNLEYKNVLPYIIKEVGGIKIGIIGVSPISFKQKMPGIKLSDPNTAVFKAVSQLQNNGANIIILLSQLQEREDLDLINSVQGIDILIEGHSRAKEPYSKIGNTLVLRPAWEGRKLGKLTFQAESGKIADYKVEEFRLSDQIPDDPKVLAVLPKCFLDNNCKQEGFIGTCQDPGSFKSECIFVKANKVRLFIITSKDCVTCETSSVVNSLKKQFPGLTVSYLYYPDRLADNFIKRFKSIGLPVYFLGKEVENEKNFENLKANLEFSQDYYLLMPKFSGFAYFLNREKSKGKLDLFISLYDKETAELLGIIKEYNPQIHFLAIEQPAGGFEAAHGQSEIEEYLRAVCMGKYNPQYFWDYISCRAKNITSSWWENCASNLDANQIKTCATGSEGVSLLKENIGLNRELMVMYGPTYLLNNQEIFASKGVPSKEDLETIIKR